MNPMIETIAGDALADFCERHHIQRLALFGSILRNDFRPESDVDVLVDFLPGERVGLIRLGMVEAELSDLLGRTVDMSLTKSLNPHFRDEVLREAQTIYDAA